jgi:hypothetical protein
MTTLTQAHSGLHPQHDHGPYRFERRQVDRWPAQGVATAFCLSSDAFGQMHELALVDYSHDGLGAMCSQPIAPGTEISVGFSMPGHLARRGTVLRCEPCGEGYRVAVQFQLRLAA